jgi:c-di-GMP-binding flagellar brake protein YcgR
MIGVTADISEGGCALLWPEPLPLGHTVPVRVHFGGRAADWQAQVVSSQGGAAKGWYRYGVRFHGLSAADVDLINDSVFSLVVPDLFQTLAPASWFSLNAQRVVRWIVGRSQPRAQRHVVPVPVRARCAGGSFASVTRDVSETGVSLASPIPVPLGSIIDLALFVPGRTLRCDVSVIRCVARRSRAGFDTWILGLHFESIQDAVEIAAIRELEAA